MKEFFDSHWFLLLMLLIASVLVFVWLYVFNRQKLNAKWWEILILTVLHTGYGVLTVKFFAVLEVGFNFEKAGNMSLFGGIFFMPLMYFCYAKIKKLPLSLVFDVFVVCLAGTLALARVNCLYTGCCIGRFLSGDSGPRFPARELDILIHVLFLILVIPIVIKSKTKGEAYPIYMIAYGSGRFVIEWFRESNSPYPFHLAHIWAIASILIGVLLLIVTVVFKKKKEASVNEK